MTQTPRPIRIALDAMGGDHAPQEIVRGALQSTRGGIHLLLVGEPESLRPHLPPGQPPASITIVPSQGTIQEGEPPTVALREKPRASIVVATALVKEGRADAVITMGPTGAAMACATLMLGTLEGVERPALGGPILGGEPPVVVIDIGANLDSRPSQLPLFAALGAVLAQTIFRVAEPRVGLLSVGAEEGKGNRLVREGYPLLQASGLNFVGNVEGNDIPRRTVDVVVCDGFVGNILMKFSEGLGTLLMDHLQRELGPLLPEEQRRALLQGLFGLTNPVLRLGAGPLLGVNGIVAVGHGRSRAPQVAAAIETARLAVEADFVGKMRARLARMQF